MDQYKLKNRRYIGCKTKLLEIIYDTVCSYGYKSDASFVDLFAGTGVVGEYFAQNRFIVSLNDTLLSNVVAYKAFLGNDTINLEKVNNEIAFLNSINSSILTDNYFSKTYGNKYYSLNDAKKIGYIRDYIEENKDKYSEREFCYLVTSLMYTADRIANTVGHFESFLKRTPEEKGVVLMPLSINNTPCKFYNEDANNLIKHVSGNILYIDPPYNARQYVNFYHVLENLVRWNKPTEFEGNSMKFKRQELKSDYCRNKAPQLFEELIENANFDLIVVSYNNTYKAGSISSINTISENQIIEVLEKKGSVNKVDIDYNAFNAGKTELRNHKEYLYICDVKGKKNEHY